jgi:multiple sugar transport system permease protein
MSFYWSKLSLMLMGLWTGIGGYNMILYLAGLQGINPELYEAAEVDGASAWQKFRHITWPMLSPTTFFIFIMSLIGGFQGGFQAAYVMTEGGPQGSTTTISYYIFQELYVNDHPGYASAIAWFLFLVVFTLTIFSWKRGGKVVHYD